MELKSPVSRFLRFTFQIHHARRRQKFGTVERMRTWVSVFGGINCDRDCATLNLWMSLHHLSHYKTSPLYVFTVHWVMCAGLKIADSVLKSCENT
jgi:hypothetical protein